MKKVYLLIAAIVLWGAGFTQPLLHSRPLQFNGGFAGQETAGRINTDVLLMDPLNFTQGLMTNYLSYDKLDRKIGGAYGIELASTLNGVYQKNNSWNGMFGLTYSPKFVFRDKMGINPFIKGTFSRIKIKNSLSGTSLGNNSSPTQLSSHRTYVTLLTDVGVLINTEKFYAGMSVSQQLVQQMRLLLYNDVVGNIDTTQRFKVPGPIFSMQFGVSRESKRNENRNFSLDVNLTSDFRAKRFSSRLNLGWTRKTFMYGFSLWREQQPIYLVGNDSLNNHAYRDVFGFLFPKSEAANSTTYMAALLLGYKMKRVTIKYAYERYAYGHLNYLPRNQLALQYTFKPADVNGSLRKRRRF